MKKTLFLLFMYLTTSILVSAQFTIDHSHLSFPETETDGNSVKEIKVHNSSQQSILFNCSSSQNEFSASPTSFTLMPGASQTIEVDFRPSQNMMTHGVLFIKPEGLSGDKAVVLKGQGTYNDPYYASTQNLEQEALKSELKRIISKNYVNLGYTTARDRMYDEIDNDGGKVTCVYTGRSASFSTRSGANNNSFNCEHTWPQSLFNKSEPERADIHHLFPTDVNANSRRGSYAFGTVNSPSWQEGGSKLGGSKFEPRDDHKGDVARAMFYFALRYQNYSGFLTGQESILRSWYYDDLPDTKEVNRNQAIFKYQKNRNPFVDHPEFLDRISSISSTATGVSLAKVCVSRQQVNWINPDVAGEAKFAIVLNNCGTIDLSKLTFETQNDYVKLESVDQVIEVDSVQILWIRINSATVGTKGVFDETITIKNDGLQLSLVTFKIETGGKGNVDLHGFQFHFDSNQSNLQVENTEGGPVSIELIDQNGRTLHSFSFRGNHKQFKLPDLVRGVYYIRATGRQGTRVGKFFVP